MIGKYIELYLLKHGMSQVDLSDAIDKSPGTINHDKSPGTINHLINGRKRIDNSLANLLAKTFNTDSDFWTTLQDQADNGTIKSPFEILYLFGNSEPPNEIHHSRSDRSINSYVNIDNLIEKRILQVKDEPRRHGSPDYYKTKITEISNYDGSNWLESYSTIEIPPNTSISARSRATFILNSDNFIGLSDGSEKLKKLGLKCDTVYFPRYASNTSLSIKLHNTTEENIIINEADAYLSVFFFKTTSF